MKEKQMTFWTFYHNDLGFLKFGSYGKVDASNEPCPKWFYKEQSDAERYMKSRLYWHNGKENRLNQFSCNGKKYSCSEVKLVTVTVGW